MRGIEARTAGTGLRHRLRQRFAEWVSRRIPPARAVTLDQKRIFIFPSRTGLFFALCLLVMLITAINYQNNMSFALTFLLATLFVVGVLHTYANLSGLTIRALRASPAFPGQQSEFSLQLERGRQREHFGLHLRWPGSSDAWVNLTDQDSVQVHLHMPVARRGWYSPGRLLLESTYPLGLLRCWTWIDLDLYALVYPQPLACPELPGLATDQPDGAAIPIVGSDDFYGFRDYREGDSLRQIHWKGLARGQGVQTKQYGAYADRSVWLDWDMFAGMGTERRLSHLCYWALQFESRDEEYGLRLPGLVLEPGSGDRHRDRVLQALALHGIEGRPR
ncbi:MAG: DUF58 domain-containing protein [Halieaceae bacterium]|nr:DUF58 domain-containing protein [Halieaceae bacterium]